MTTVALNDTDIEAISNKVCEKLLEMLPPTIFPIIQETLPNVFQDTLPNVLQENIPSLAEKITEQQRMSSIAETEANDYINNNYALFDRIFNTRTKKFEQFTRCVHLLTLYDECLAENPPYIPKKFRENKLHVRNQREQEIVFNKSMSNLKCEYELLTSRKCEFEERFKKCDEEIHEHLLKAESINQFVKIEISRMWTSECKGKEENANNDWKKKLEGVKAGFVKDKIEFKKSTRFPTNTIPQDDNENQPQHEERTAETSDAMSISSQNSENKNSQNSNNTPTTTMNTEKDVN